jgi:(R,R)-butanediol dehydrogenase/meso-butanediol dehydrogenase/diacetyl reductase
MAEAGAIIGHEFCGTIAATGRNVKRWKEGDRVVGGGGSPPPGMQRAAAKPRYSARTVGFEAYAWGGFAEYVAMDEWKPSPIPDNVSWETAVLAEPCAIAVHAVRNSRFRVGDDVVIMGAGPIGLLVQQVLHAGGARSARCQRFFAAREFVTREALTGSNAVDFASRLRKRGECDSISRSRSSSSRGASRTATGLPFRVITSGPSVSTSSR